MAGFVVIALLAEERARGLIRNKARLARPKVAKP